MWTQQERLPKYRGFIYDNRNPEQLCLLQFDTPIVETIKGSFISSLWRDYCDQEMLSHLHYGVRFKATDNHLHFRLPPHQESLKQNCRKIHSQFAERVEWGFMTLHEQSPFDPCWYVAQGTTERKDNPDDPRLTDNHSYPHTPVEAHQEPVVSLNAMSRSHAGLPPNPHEDKHSAPDVMTNAATLRHIADLSGEGVYAVSHDGKFFFDQLQLAPEELYKTVKFVRRLDPSHVSGSHLCNHRLGFGGSPNSNVGQRVANMFCVVFCWFMNRLDGPHHSSAHPMVQQWLTERRSLTPAAMQRSKSPDWSGKIEYCRQDRRYTADMFTDDFLCLCLGSGTAARAIMALYLTSINMGLILAGMRKAIIGTSMRHIGASFFFMLGITAIPQDKVLRALHRLSLTRQGKIRLKEYEKLVGLLVHCWFLVNMKPALMASLHDPLTFAKHARKGPDWSVAPSVFPDLAATTWPSWDLTLQTSTCSYFSAAFPCDTRVPVGGLEVHVSGDAFRNPPTATEPWTAGIGGFLHGYWWYLQILAEHAALIDITALEFLAIPGNLECFDSLLPTPRDDTNTTKVCIHADGYAAALDMRKQRVKCPRMRFVHDEVIKLPSFTRRQKILTILHEFGLGNVAADAASRNHKMRIFALCASLNIRPVQVPVPPLHRLACAASREQSFY